MANQEIIRNGERNLVIDNVSFGGYAFVELTIETKYIHDYQELSFTLDEQDMKILRDYLSVLLDKRDTKEMKNV